MREILHANRWRQRQKKEPIDEHFRLLLRGIAAQIARSNGFCTFHYDGDSTWANRSGSVVAQQFEEYIIGPLSKHLRGWIENSRTGKTPAEIEMAVARMMSRLLPVVPHYSIESWLFQHTELLAEKCHCRDAKCSEIRQTWCNDRALLDEIVQVKECVCVRDTANATLAEAMTPSLFKACVSVDKSLAATRNNWLAREALTGALESVRRPQWGEEPDDVTADSDRNS